MSLEVKKIKVFIFANCHGAIYKKALEEVDKEKTLDIEHIISYQNMGNFESIKSKFEECDILIIQPVQNYEKFKIENIKPLLKKECQLIRVPFFRFNGYWDKSNVKELKKFTQPAVMFFPKVNDTQDVNGYLEEVIDAKNVISNFESGIEELQALEKQGDIDFVQFFLKNHKSIPFFRDPYHPTDIVNKYLSSQIVEIIRTRYPKIEQSNFKVSNVWEKEYGHFKPIQNKTAEVLGLRYDLDSFFKVSREKYLTSIIEYENREQGEIINDLGKLNKLFTKNNNNLEKSKLIVVHNNNSISYDEDWQYPAITEQYAYQKICELDNLGENSIYIGFPWATLIDKLNKKGQKASQELFDILKKIKEKIPTNKQVITVCQHILMLKFEYIFLDLGITHVFWTHAIKNQYVFPKNSAIKIYPFPLYPVQAVKVQTINYQKKTILYSFVGAKSNEWYLTQSRTYILELLKNDKRGAVIGRDTWHFNNVVYDHQIQNSVDSNKELVNSQATEEFKEIVQKSIFSLCPSGTGPNSIRLWESIGFGTIPVILADTYLPPGNENLWKEAVVFCEETQEAIRILPDRLEKIAQDPELLERKRHAMKQLWMLYGPDCFIYDIQDLFLQESNVNLKNDNFHEIIQLFLEQENPSQILLVLAFNGFLIKALSNYKDFIKLYIENDYYYEALNLLLKKSSTEQVNNFKKILKNRNISFRETEI